jgi:hypothetical protein
VCVGVVQSQDCSIRDQTFSHQCIVHCHLDVIQLRTFDCGTPFILGI